MAHLGGHPCGLQPIGVKRGRGDAQTPPPHRDDVIVVDRGVGEERREWEEEVGIVEEEREVTTPAIPFLPPMAPKKKKNQMPKGNMWSPVPLPCCLFEM